MWGLIAVAASLLGSYVLSQVNKPKIPAQPPPAGYASPEGTQVWNAAKNQYEWVPAPKTPEQEAQEAGRSTKIAELEGSLNQTAPERQAEIDKYQKAYVDQMMTPLTEAYEKGKLNLNENFASRGLSGSRAMVDTLAELEKDWQTTQTNVQNQAIQMGESLKQQDYQNKLSALDALRQGSSLEEAEGIRQQGMAQTSSQAANAIQNANWQNMMGATLQQWAIGQQTMASGMQTAGTLGLLYGLGTKAQTTPTAQQTALRQGSLSQIYGQPSSPGGYAGYYQYPGLMGRGY